MLYIYWHSQWWQGAIGCILHRAVWSQGGGSCAQTLVAARHLMRRTRTQQYCLKMPMHCLAKAITRRQLSCFASTGTWARQGASKSTQACMAWRGPSLPYVTWRRPDYGLIHCTRPLNRPGRSLPTTSARPCEKRDRPPWHNTTFCWRPVKSKTTKMAKTCYKL